MDLNESGKLTASFCLSNSTRMVIFLKPTRHALKNNSHSLTIFSSSISPVKSKILSHFHYIMPT